MISDGSSLKFLAKPSILALALGLTLMGCEGVRNQLGLSRTAPDEFRVVSRAPLTVPPDFALRPPQPGAPRPQVGTPRDQAKRAVTGNSGLAITGLQGNVQSTQRSFGEEAFLKQVGSDDVPPDIRFLIDSESNRINEESGDFLRNLIFWGNDEPAGVVVDPNAEAKRLQENATLGRPINEGETPTIERQERGILEGIF